MQQRHRVLTPRQPEAETVPVLNHFPGLRLLLSLEAVAIVVLVVVVGGGGGGDRVGRGGVGCL